ncbi:MAG: SpoIIE family protein phosphatase [Candidatus Riflebacteria bacterium]|nr:SpoIIE family protein phosphatase [Candidatus Riflebacteria bacterium]
MNREFDSKPASFFDPAVAFANQLSFRQKISLIFLGFALPLAVSMILMLGDCIHREELTAMERQGIEIETLLSRLLAGLQQFRVIDHAAAIDPDTFSNMLQTTRNEIEETLESIDSKITSTSQNSDISELWKEIPDGWKQVANASAGEEPFQIFQRRSIHIDLLQSFIVEVGYRFNLLLESEMESLFLAESISQRLPEMSEHFARIRGLGMEAVVSKHLDPGLRENIITLKASLEESFRWLSGWLKRPAFSFYRKVHPALSGPFLQLLKERSRFETFVLIEIIQTNPISIPLKDYLDTSNVNAGIIFGLADLAATTLNKHLEERQTALSREKGAVFAVILFIGLLGLYLAAGYYVSLQRTVNAIEDVSGQLTNRHLRESVTLESQDELGDVMRSFNHVALALKESEEKYRDLYENAPIAYFTIDQTGTIKVCNNRAGILIGITPPNLTGRRFAEFFVVDANEQKLLHKVFQSFFAGDSIYGQELRLQRADGQVRWVGMNMNPIRDSLGKICESRTALIDITDRKEAEEALDKARQSEAAIAGEIQRVLLQGIAPESFPGAELTFFSVPSLAVGGDFFIFYPHSEQVFDLVIADVMGKGVPAALIAAAAKAEIERSLSRLAHLPQIPPMETIVGNFHREFTPQLDQVTSFITFIYARLDFGNNVLTQINLGHPPLIQFRASDGCLKEFFDSSVPIGLPGYKEIPSKPIPFSSGDIFCFYSDGVFEPRNISGECFGNLRLRKLLLSERMKAPKEIVTSLLDSVRTFASIEHFPDDFTVILAKIC